MGRLIVLFFLLPWWAYIPASIGVVWLGEQAYEKALEAEADKAAALDAPMPEAVDLGVFDSDRDIHAAREVRVVGLIDHDLDYELVESTNGVPTTTRYLYMMFGADEFGSTEVRAALMLDKREEARFVEGKADEWAVDATADYWVYDVNGFATRTTTLDNMADEAIAEQGLTKAEDFVYIEPFFDGREAALTPHGVPDQTRQIFWLIAAAMALTGVVKRVLSVRARPAGGALDETDLTGGETYAVDPVPAPAAAAFTVPQGVSDDTPLGRLARRSARPAAPAPVEAPAHHTFAAASDLSYATQSPDPDPYAARAANARPHPDETGYDEAVGSRFPPVPDDDMPADDRGRSSDASFYAKLALAMLVVGGLAYDPSLLNAAVPFAVVAGFWGVVYLGFRKIRRGARRVLGGDPAAPRHRRRPDSAAQAVAVGVGGHRIDLTAPVQSTGRERGVF